MASHSRGDYVGAVPSDVPQSTKLHCSDSVAEWRSREQLEPSPPSTSPAYWDSDDEDESNSSSIVGPKPSDLYGKFTWKIENFSEISKRELRSNVFEVGGYKWYILVYPQGCDVCNHLSLFLCVADYDKLLPGWSHFAQFTIAVVNKDPKKSKYSDTLHRFCKKEHDWGWKKFMELSKVLDGFTVADTLVIKAQVQVIRENPHRPFRCLDCQYRRELVRVYLTNVEGICRRFVEEKREKLGKLMEDTPRWTSFRAFWSAVEEGARYRLAREKTDVILKAVVKRFFNEKEVTSTLVMDALYSGCKALDYRSRNKKGKINGVDMEEAVNPVVWVDKDAFVLAGDVLVLLERAVSESLPPYKDDKGPQNRTKEVGSGDDFGKDSVERDERRLTELGRRTVEMFVLAHLYTNRVEVAYREAVALKRQEELIREEEAAGQAETEMRIKREASEKEKRSKKKQAKLRRKDRKEKDKEAEEKKVRGEQEQRQRQDLSGNSLSKHHSQKSRELSPLVSTEAGEDEDELSGLDPIDDVVGILGPATEDGDADHTGWEREGSFAPNTMEAGFSGALLEEATRNRRSSRQQQAILDDSSSTCSSDSLPSVRNTVNKSFAARPTLPELSNVLPGSGRTGVKNEIYDADGQYIEADGMLRATGLDANGTGEPSSSTSSVGVDSETVILSLKDQVRWLEQRLFEKEEEVVLLQEQLSLLQHQMGLDVLTPPVTGLSMAVAEDSSLAHPPPSTSAGIGMSISRPSSAPGLVPGGRPNIPITSGSVQPCQPLARSMSVGAGRPVAGIEGRVAPHANGKCPPVVPSYKNATIGKMRSFGSLAASLSPAVPLAPSSGPETAGVSHILRENSGGGSTSGHPSVEITFGTVTPELLHDDQSELPPVEQPQSNARDQSQHMKESQQQREGAHPSIPRHTAQQQVLYHQRSQGSSSDMNGGSGISSVRQAITDVIVAESINNGAVMSEEFPHLDIINDLLDEDQNLGMALKILQHPGTSGYNRPLSLAGHKLNYGQLTSDRGVNGLSSDGDNRSRGAENSEEQTNSNGLRENVRMNGPYQHPPLARLHSQHTGVLDGVSSHYWPIGSSAMPSGNNSSGRNGLVDSHLAYSLVQGHHLAVPNCSGFALGHNGYTVYAPAQQP